MIKHLITTILAAVIFSAGLWGCTQTIIEPDRLQINTFLMTSGLETLHYDPAGIFEVGKYKGVPSNLEFEYNPITNTYKIKTEAKY